MKKMRDHRTFLSVMVAGFTGSAVAVSREPVVNGLRSITDAFTVVPNNNLGNGLLLILLLVPALFITHLIIQYLATKAFNIDAYKEFILKRDYVGGYWLVDNRIDDKIVSTGLMFYKIENEKLEIEATHYSPYEDEDKPKLIAFTKSIEADCVDGKYHNLFEIEGVGFGFAKGTFSVTTGRIPDKFQVQVTVTTPPSALFEWGKNAQNWLTNQQQNNFTSFEGDERSQLILSMAKGRVSTMIQCGKRISKEEIDQAKLGDPDNFERKLAQDHFDKLTAINS